MEEYLIRKAVPGDIPFLADVVIAAEKSNSDKLSFTTLFNLAENKAKELLISMFEEEIDGCEFSLSSYLITEFNGEPVAAFGAWVEEHDGNLPSGILKSNLISFTFGKESVEHIKSKSDIINGIYIEREKETLQFEYLYVAPVHRGKGLGDGLIKKHILDALLHFSFLKKAQVQTYLNNTGALKLYERNGFQIKKNARSNHPDVLNYLPHHEKVLMEKILN